MDYENTIMMKESKDEYKNKEPLNIAALENFMEDLIRRPKIYFYGVGYELEIDENNRVAQIRYSLPSLDARDMYDFFRSSGVKLGMSSRNSWVDSLEAKYPRSEMGPYVSEEYND